MAERSGEQVIGMVSKMYDMRNAARFMLGDRFPAAMAKGAENIRAVQAVHKCGEIEAAMKLAKVVDGDTKAVMIIVASAVEMIEPTTPPPTPEQKRDLEGVLGKGTKHGSSANER